MLRDVAARALPEIPPDTLVPLGEVEPLNKDFGLLIEGIATTRDWNAWERPLAAGLKTLDGRTTTRQDGLDPRKAITKLPLPLLWRHEWDKKLGEMFAVSATDLAVHFKACIVPPGTPDYDSALLERVWDGIQSRVFCGVSFATRVERRGKGAWRGVELSMCPVGGNPYAIITRAIFPNGELIERSTPSFTREDAQRAFVDFETRSIASREKDDAAVATIQQRAAALQAGGIDIRAMIKEEVAAWCKDMHRGVWREDVRDYQRGQMATRSGSTWSCQRDEATGRPGDSGDWLLVVKAGRDAQR